jgi:hypothetical protein
MLRRSVAVPEPLSLREGDTQPMSHPAHPAEPMRPVAPMQPLPPPRSVAVEPTARQRLLDRLRAAGVHLALSSAVAAAVLAVVFLAWYPGPLSQLLGVGAILLIMLGADVVLGPLFTLIVFDRRKRSLRWDLATIAALQVAALLYGLYTIYQGRPAFVVLVKDRFEVISPADLRPEDRAAARGNPFARIDPTGPRWVASRMPDSAQERSDILIEAISHGRDVQHHPRLYDDYAVAAPSALERALPIERLRTLNREHGARIDALVARTGRDESTLRYLPLRGPAKDGAVIVGHPDGRVLEVVALLPW